jgi:hypothetical protein
MKRFACGDCDTEFQAENAERCLKCGSTDIDSLEGTIVHPGANGEAVEGKNSLPAVRLVLRGLCESSYDVSFGSAEWESLVDAALEEIVPFLK